jgi:hypothetical protein
MVEAALVGGLFHFIRRALAETICHFGHHEPVLTCFERWWPKSNFGVA